MKIVNKEFYKKMYIQSEKKVKPSFLKVFLKPLVILLVLIMGLTACQGTTGSAGLEKQEEQENASAGDVSMDKGGETTLVIGFVPFQNSDQFIENLKPFDALLSEKLHRKVESFVASNYVGVVAGLQSKKIQVAFLPPFAYLLAEQTAQAKAILMAKNKRGKVSYTSTIYVRKDSPIQSLEDLKGKKIAFVDQSSSSGYIFPASLLKQNGLAADKDYEQVLSGGHDKSLQALLEEDVDAAAVFTEAPERYAKDFPEAKSDLRALATTKEVPGISVVVSGDLSETDRQSLQDFFLHLEKDEEALDIIKKVLNLYGFSPLTSDATVDPYQAVRDAVKDLDIDLEKAG